MSLVHDYSSGEEEGATSPAIDAFGLSSLPNPISKKMRVDAATVTTPMVAEAAPAVLSEVSLH